MDVKQTIADIRAWAEELVGKGETNAGQVAHGAADALTTADTLQSSPTPTSGPAEGDPVPPEETAQESESDATGQPAQTASEIHGRAADPAPEAPSE